jgi:molybdopterin-guanine dinucleotide biosynthesis protein A
VSAAGENPYEAAASSRGPVTRPRHILVVANETVAGRTLIEAIEERAAAQQIRVTVISPQNDPPEGYVVYEDSRRSSAARRLRRTLDLLHEAGIAARGTVVDPDPLQALRDALHQYAPVDEIIISTHPGTARSKWLRSGLVERARKAAADIPVTHVEVDLASPRERAHVLVIANQTIVGGPLLEAIRERAVAGPAEFTLVAPADEPGVSRRLQRALAELAQAGVEASGHIGDPDPVTAALNTVHDEQVDEIIVSTFPEATSGWLRRDVVGRIEKSAALPVRHVVVEPAEAEALI